MDKQKYYITTAIAYTSGKPHIGNTYEIVLADAIARYKRQEGYDVFFQTGTDEHGQKIELKAEEAGITPKEFVDNVSGEIKRIWDLMNTSYDKFIRTTDADHEKQIQKRIGATGNDQKDQRPLGISHCTQNCCAIVIQHKKRHSQKIDTHIKSGKIDHILRRIHQLQADSGKDHSQKCHDDSADQSQQDRCMYCF